MTCSENCGITLGELGMVHTGTCISLKDAILSYRKALVEKDAIIEASRLVIRDLKVEIFDLERAERY